MIVGLTNMEANIDHFNHVCGDLGEIASTAYGGCGAVNICGTGDGASAGAL